VTTLTDSEVPTKGARWAGYLLTALVAAFLTFDATIKLMVIQPVVDSFARLGLPADLPRTIGALEAALVIVYLVPRTAVLGGILLTGYLGGAIMCHVRVGDPMFSHILFPVYLGIVLWAGLYLRVIRVRHLIPVRPI